MKTAALVMWVLTAGGGLVMLGIWLSGGGFRRGADVANTGSRFQPQLIFSHFGLAALGLLLWLTFVLTDTAALAWLAAALLLPVAGLGFAMLAKWLGGRASAERENQPEQRFPTVVVVAHGLAAVTTLTLVLIAAVKAL